MEIFSAISLMAETAWFTASCPSWASWDAWIAIFSVSWAFSAFCRMLEVICSMEAETSSTLEACSVAPWERFSEEAESSSLPEATFSDEVETSLTTSRNFSAIWFRARASMPTSSRWRMSRSRVKSPEAMVWANRTAPGHGTGDAHGEEERRRDAQKHRQSGGREAEEVGVVDFAEHLGLLVRPCFSAGLVGQSGGFDHQGVGLLLPVHETHVILEFPVIRGHGVDHLVHLGDVFGVFEPCAHILRQGEDVGNGLLVGLHVLGIA